LWKSTQGIDGHWGNPNLTTALPFHIRLLRGSVKTPFGPFRGRSGAPPTPAPPLPYMRLARNARDDSIGIESSD